MSGFSTPRDGGVSAQPKQISSRLLNMKFMQRAAASTAQKPDNSPSTPIGQRLPKRRRTGDYVSTPSNPNTPSSARTPTYSDRVAFSGGLSTEAQATSISSGIQNLGLNGIDTEWVLNINMPKTNGNITALTNGISSTTNIDQDKESYWDSESTDEEDDDDIWSTFNPSGRQTYGSFSRKKKKPKPATTSVDSTPATAADETSGSTKKRARDEDDDPDEGEVSSSSSGDSEDEEENGSNTDEPSGDGFKLRKKKKGTFDFKSEADLRKMDALNFQKKGFEHGLGRQRAGLSGGGGGGGTSGMNATKSPGQTTMTPMPHNRPKKKGRKSR